MSSETSFISMSSTVLQVQASSSGNLILVPAMKQRHFTAGVACSSDVRVGETVLVCETQRHSLDWKSYRMKDNGFLWQDTRPPEMSLILYSFFASVNSLPAGIVARGSFFSFCESAVGACIRPISAGLGVRLQSRTQHFCQFPFCMTEHTAFAILLFFKRFFRTF